jgi:hypothetical protein
MFIADDMKILQKYGNTIKTMMLTDSITDYGPPLLEALSVSSKNSSSWNNHAEGITCTCLKERMKRGPIHAKAAAFASTIMPVSYLLQTPALTPTLPLAPSLLGNAKHQLGLQSWYWLYGRMNGNGNGDSASASASGAVFLMIKQITVDPVQYMNVWSVTAGGENPADGSWVSKNTVFVDDRHVSKTRNSVTVTSPHLSCRLDMSTETVSAVVKYADDGFSYSISATTQRGPVYQQKDGRLQNLGPNTNMNAWSIVDGDVITDAVLGSGFTPSHHLRGPSAAGPSPSSAIPVQLEGNMFQASDAEPRYVFTAGGSVWLDYKQLGLKPFSPFQAFMATLADRNWMSFEYANFKIQLPHLQLQVFLADQDAFRTLTRTKAVVAKKAVNIWYTQGGVPKVAYDLDAHIQLTAMHNDESVPSAVQIKVGSVVYTMQSLLPATTTPPLIRDINGGANELLMSVHTNLDGSPVGVGYIEWVPGYYAPQRNAAINEAGFSHTIYNAFKPNPVSQTVFGLGVSGIYLAIIALFVLIFCWVDKMQKRQQ